MSNNNHDVGIKVTKIDCNTNDIEYDYKYEYSEKHKNWINEGVENYKIVNNKWKKLDETTESTSSTTLTNINSKDDIRNVDAIQVMDELLNKNGVFSKRVPLPDLISLLVEEWEANENAL